jgi:hypothetical protein
MHPPIDYYLHTVPLRHEEDLARAARHRQLPRRERPAARWRPLAAALLHRLADRIAREPASVVRA